jgi:pimeloyl-ACP methyl ester carboxylesterase
MFSVNDQMTTTNDVELSYSIAGAGPPLVVTSPGWGIGSDYLKHGLKPVLEHFTIVFVTTRGSGRSTRPADILRMGSADMADDIEELRRHLGLPTIDLFGHSNGGAIAISYAQRHGAHLRKLVLTSSQLLGFDASKTVQAFLDQAVTDPRYRDAVSWVAQSGPEDDDGFRRHFINRLPLYFHDPDAHAETFAHHMGESFSAWASRTQAAADRLASASQIDKLASIRAETLIVVGRHCWVCPVAISERLHAGIGGSRLIVLEQAGHFPWIEEPEHFFPEIMKFLGDR